MYLRQASSRGSPEKPKFDPFADLRDCWPSSAALQGADSDAELANYKAMTVPAAVPDPLTFWKLSGNKRPSTSKSKERLTDFLNSLGV